MNSFLSVMIANLTAGCPLTTTLTSFYLLPQQTSPSIFVPPLGMVTSDRVPTPKATESLSLSVAPVQAGEPQSLPRVRRDVHPTRPTFQNASPSYPRIPRLVSRYAKSATPNLDSQFQVNASHVQKPLSLIVQVRLFFLHVTPSASHSASE